MSSMLGLTAEVCNIKTKGKDQSISGPKRIIQSGDSAGHITTISSYLVFTQSTEITKITIYKVLKREVARQRSKHHLPPSIWA